MAPSQKAATAYDLTPYPSTSFPQSHPNRIGAIGRLFGLEVALPSQARVLELGCADGANLLPMAEQMPGATFLGVDDSQVQIAVGQKAIAAVGLRNVELRHQNILDFPASEGKFDYIIVHGIYSWVPEPVREKILQICEDHLADHGLAYVSYNALPGWGMRRALRDMLLFHTRAISDPAMKVQQARALTSFLAESVPAETGAFSTLLKAESQTMLGAVDSYLLHDILGEENTPFFFHEFAARAGRHKLQYVGEPTLAHMLAANFPEKVRQTLGRLSDNIVAQEQYMDFLRNRSFRQTLLCRAGAPLRRDLGAEVMSRFAFQGFLRTEGPVDLTPGVVVAFAGSSGAKINTADCFLKAALRTFVERSGRVFGFGELLEIARAASRPFVPESGPEQAMSEAATLAANLLALLTKGFVDLHLEPVNVGTLSEEFERPVITPLARYQSMRTATVTNRLHQGVSVDAMTRYVMVACDGTRDRAGLLDELVARVAEGKLQVSESGSPIGDLAKVRTLLAPRIDPLIRALVGHGFVAP